MADDQTRRQMLAMMLASAGAPPAAADEGDDEPDADAAPVPTTPGTPYQPLVNQPPPKGYSPPMGPPPWGGSPNPLAMSLAGGGAPSPSAGAASAGPPPVAQPAPSAPPQNRGFLASLLAGITPSAPTTGSRYNPQTGEFLPEGANAQPGAAPQPAPAAAPPGVASAGTPIAGQASDMGTPEQQEIYRVRQGLRAQQQALRAQIAGASSPEVSKIYADQFARLTSYDQQLESAYLGTIKEKTRTLDDSDLTKAEREAGGEWQEDASGNRSIVKGTEPDTAHAPTQEEAAMLAAAGHDPKDYVFKDGMPLPIAPAREANTEIVHLADGTHQVVNKQTGELVGKPIGEPVNSALPPDAIDFLANRVNQGDNSALTGLGYGATGSQNRAHVVARAAELNNSSGDAAAAATAQIRNQVGLGGEKAGARTMGTLGARINTFAEEAKQTGAMALQASDAMPREAWVPVEKIIQMGESAMNNPKLSELKAANNAFANTYSKAVNPSGVPTDEGRRAAFDLLNVAKSPEAYRATVQQLQREMNVVQNAISTSRGSQLYGGEATPSVPGVPPPAAAPKKHGVYVPGKGIQFQ